MKRALQHFASRRQPAWWRSLHLVFKAPHWQGKRSAMKWLVAATTIVCVTTLGGVGVLVLGEAATERPGTPAPTPSLTLHKPPLSEERLTSGALRPAADMGHAPDVHVQPISSIAPEAVLQDVPTGSTRSPLPALERSVAGSLQVPASAPPALRQQRDAPLGSPAASQDNRVKLAALPRSAPLEPAAGGPTRTAAPQRAPVLGEWLVEAGAARIVIRPCGANLCGLVNWPKEDGELGTQMLRDMKPTGPDRWEGTIYDPTTGRRAAANINLGADNLLRVEGCVVDTDCHGRVWSRVTSQARPAARQR